MGATTRYAEIWESFWRDAPPEAGSVAWDAPPELAAALHLPLFAPHFAGSRAVVDVGCGNGTQTRYLAGRYPRVIGADVSAAAVARARASGGAEFRQLDATVPEQVRELAAELGDADVYLRGVLHQCEPGDRALLAASVATLTGDSGRAFVVEPAEAAGEVFGALMQRPEGPPAALTAVFAHGIRPLEMPDESVPVLFSEAGLRVLDSGAVPLAMTVRHTDGARVALPSNWLVAGRRDGRAEV